VALHPTHAAMIESEEEIDALFGALATVAGEAASRSRGSKRVTPAHAARIMADVDGALDEMFGATPDDAADSYVGRAVRHFARAAVLSPVVAELAELRRAIGTDRMARLLLVARGNG
jgi:hypothetical protein